MMVFPFFLFLLFLMCKGREKNGWKKDFVYAALLYYTLRYATLRYFECELVRWVGWVCDVLGNFQNRREGGREGGRE